MLIGDFVLHHALFNAIATINIYMYVHANIILYEIPICIFNFHILLTTAITRLAHVIPLWIFTGRLSSTFIIFFIYPCAYIYVYDTYIYMVYNLRFISNYNYLWPQTTVVAIIGIHVLG